jgi:hypothetical protein
MRGRRPQGLEHDTRGSTLIVGDEQLKPPAFESCRRHLANLRANHASEQDFARLVIEPVVAWIGYDPASYESVHRAVRLVPYVEPFTLVCFVSGVPRLAVKFVPELSERCAQALARAAAGYLGTAGSPTYVGATDGDLWRVYEVREDGGLSAIHASLASPALLWGLGPPRLPGLAHPPLSSTQAASAPLAEAPEKPHSTQSSSTSPTPPTPPSEPSLQTGSASGAPSGTTVGLGPPGRSATMDPVAGESPPASPSQTSGSATSRAHPNATRPQTQSTGGRSQPATPVGSVPAKAPPPTASGAPRSAVPPLTTTKTPTPSTPAVPSTSSSPRPAPHPGHAAQKPSTSATPLQGGLPNRTPGVSTPAASPSPQVRGRSYKYIRADETFTKPAYILVHGQRFDAESWGDAVAVAAKEHLRRRGTLPKRLLPRQKRVYFSPHVRDISETPRQLCAGWWYEANLNAALACKIAVTLLLQAGLKKDDFDIFYIPR